MKNCKLQNVRAFHCLHTGTSPSDTKMLDFARILEECSYGH